MTDQYNQPESEDPEPMPYVDDDVSIEAAYSAPPRIKTPGVNLQKGIDYPVEYEIPGEDLYTSTTRSGRYLRQGTLGEYDADRVLLGNQFAQVGYVVDMWGELIVDAADKVEDFWLSLMRFLAPQSENVEAMYWSRLEATGVYARTREMFFIRKKPVTVTVYLAEFGRDLYISYRTFLRGNVDTLRVGFFALIAYLLHLLFINLRSGALLGVRGSVTSFVDFIVLAVSLLVVFVLVIGWSYVYRGGDFVNLLREPINELNFDDAVGLTSLVYKGLMTAAEEVDLKLLTLEHHEEFYVPKNRPKSRF